MAEPPLLISALTSLQHSITALSRQLTCVVKALEQVSVEVSKVQHAARKEAHSEPEFKDSLSALTSPRGNEATSSLDVGGADVNEGCDAQNIVSRRKDIEEFAADAKAKAGMNTGMDTHVARRSSWSQGRPSTAARRRKRALDGPRPLLVLRSDRRINLNIGGRKFTTSFSTVTREDSMLSSMLSGRFPLVRDAKGCFFIDRDAEFFPHILNYLRDGATYLHNFTLLDSKRLLQEAQFYQISNLVLHLNRTIKAKKARIKREITHEKEYKLRTGVRSADLVNVFRRLTNDEGYDFEAFTQEQGTGRFHLVFSKKLSRGEMQLLDRLTRNF